MCVCAAVRVRLAALIFQLHGGTKQLLWSWNRLTHSFRHTHLNSREDTQPAMQNALTHSTTTNNVHTLTPVHKAFGLRAIVVAIKN